MNEAIILILILIPVSNSMNPYTEAFAIIKSIPLSYMIFSYLKISFSNQTKGIKGINY